MKKSKSNINFILVMLLGVASICVCFYGLYLVYEHNLLVDKYNNLIGNSVGIDTCVDNVKFFCNVGCLYGLTTFGIEFDKNLTTEKQRINMTSQCEDYCNSR